MSYAAKALTATAALILSCAANAMAPDAETDTTKLAQNHIETLRGETLDWQQAVRQPLLRLWQLSQAFPEQFAETFHSPVHLRDGNRVHVEIRYDPDLRAQLHAVLDLAEVEVTHDIVDGGWLEAIIGLDQLPELAGQAEVGLIGLARLPQWHGVTGTTTEGVILGNVDAWHAAGIEGNGTIIGVIDAFLDTAGEIAGLQTSGDWPANAQLELIPSCSDAFGYPPEGALVDPVAHGNGVVEIIHDLAPASDYRLYDPCSAAGVIASVHAAVDAGVDIINLSLTLSGDTPGDGTAPGGSLAEAIEYARDNDVVVSISAGNGRQNHWGGEFSNPEGDGPGSLHHWSGISLEWFNFATPSGSECIANGEVLNATLYWDDWIEPANDYDLILWRFDSESEPFATSTNLQSGAVWQQPMETIAIAAHTEGQHAACAPGEAKYAWTIRNTDASGGGNFRFWSANLEHRTFSSTLGTPADSPAALTVGSIGAGDQLVDAASAEGPLLSAGGSAPLGDEYPKPDVVSFSEVSNTTFGTFSGTSVSAAHVSGMAALLGERHGWAEGSFTAEQVAQRIRAIARQGSNDYEPAGHDFPTGWGRLRFQAEAAMVVTSQPAHGLVNHALSPPIVVELLDDDGLHVLSGPSRSIEITFGQNPTNGQAQLLASAPYPVVDGIGALPDVTIDHHGTGFTLIATATETGMSVETDPFDIIEEIFSDRFAP